MNIRNQTDAINASPFNNYTYYVPFLRLLHSNQYKPNCVHTISQY